MAMTALVDVASGMFLEDGQAADGVTRIRVSVPRNPDPRVDRFSGDATAPFRTATAQEVADYEAAAATAHAVGQFDGAKALKAAVVTSLWGRLNRPPTAQEIAAERARFAAVFKSLP